MNACAEISLIAKAPTTTTIDPQNLPSVAWKYLLNRNNSTIKPLVKMTQNQAVSGALFN
jgi:hypothetical protein